MNIKPFRIIALMIGALMQMEDADASFKIKIKPKADTAAKTKKTVLPLKPAKLPGKPVTKAAPKPIVKAVPKLPAKPAPKPVAKPAAKIVEKMPSFVGNISTWLSLHLRYPSPSHDRGEQGRVVTEFVIDQTGAVKNVRVRASSRYPLLDAEAVRAVREMPRWRPGTQDGKPVSVIFTLPITFKLD